MLKKSVVKALLKPHHFLDIIKLYGAGLEYFTPDFEYHHNFYKVGNLILENPKTAIILTINADDICKSCKFNKNGKCTDKIKNFYQNKEQWNKTVDKRILKRLDLKIKNQLTTIELSKLAKKKLTKKIIIDIWKERPKNGTNKRIINLLKGLNKYINKYSK